MKKKYLDANIFLNSVLYDDKKAGDCKRVLREAADKKIVATTSLLTWDEVVHVIKKNLGRKIAMEEGKKFLKFPNITFIDVNKDIISKAQKTLETFNLNPRDAIHVATALSQDCSEIISDDSDFDVIKDIRRISPGKFNN